MNEIDCVISEIVHSQNLALVRLKSERIGANFSALVIDSGARYERGMRVNALFRQTQATLLASDSVKDFLKPNAHLNIIKTRIAKIQHSEILSLVKCENGICCLVPNHSQNPSADNENLNENLNTPGASLANNFASTFTKGAEVFCLVNASDIMLEIIAPKTAPTATQNTQAEQNSTQKIGAPTSQTTNSDKDCK